MEVETFESNQFYDCLSRENHNEHVIKDFSDLLNFLWLIEPVKSHNKNIDYDAGHDKTLKVLVLRHFETQVSQAVSCVGGLQPHLWPV